MSNFMPATTSLEVPGARSEGVVRRGAKALVSSGSRVLLVRERHDDGRTFWTLPGGGAHPQESLTEALRRECEEELDCWAVVGQHVTEFWYAHHGDSAAVTAYAVFDCAVATEVDPVEAEGVLEARWVDPARPPASTIPQIRQLLDDHRSAARPQDSRSL